CAVQPLILIVEDLHWTDSESLATLDSLVASLPTNRILLIVTFRPEFVHAWSSRSHFSQLRLDPLAAVGVEMLLNSLAGDDASLSPVKAKLIALSAGNPLFIEEGINTLVEQGILIGAPRAYRLGADANKISLPDSVRAIIAARIDRLDPDCKQLLQ